MHLEISLADEFFLMSYICICICTCICSILRLCWPTGDSWWEHLGGQGGAAGRSLRPTRQNQNHGGWMGEGDNMDKSIKSPNKPQSGLFELIWVNILLFKRYVVWTSFAIASLFNRIFCSRVTSLKLIDCCIQRNTESEVRSFQIYFESTLMLIMRASRCGLNLQK